LTRLVIQFKYAKLERIFQTYNEARKYADQYNEQTEFTVYREQTSWEEVGFAANETLRKFYTSSFETDYI